MSTLLDSLLTKEQRAECADTDLTLAELDAQFGPLTKFVVFVKRGAEVVRCFEAMGRNEWGVVEQHMGLADPSQGQTVSAKPVPPQFSEEWFELSDLMNCVRDKSGANERARDALVPADRRGVWA